MIDVDGVESSIGFNAGIKADQIMKGARSNYNNMSVQFQWNEVYPRDAELLALKTQVTTLEKNLGGTPTVLTMDCKKSKKAIKKPHQDLTKNRGHQGVQVV